MSYLLDTCVLSEFTKRQPDARVVAWVANADEGALFMSVITVGEIKRGIERMSPSLRRDELDSWLRDGLLERFRHRLIPLDPDIMLLWGELTARLEVSGRAMPVMDSLIAASALYHHLSLVTRNGADFQGSGVSLVNPWVSVV